MYMWCHYVCVCVCVACVCVCSYMREASQWPTIFTDSFFFYTIHTCSYICVLYYYGEGPANWLFLEYTIKRD